MDERQKYLADLENRTTIAWRFHNQYPEVDIDAILEGIKKETAVIQGVAEVEEEVEIPIPEPEPEPEPTAVEIAEKEAEIAKAKEIEELTAKLAELNKK